MMFLDCPAHLDAGDAARCRLPAEVSCRFTMQSADGPIDSAMIRCPAGHWFTRLSNPSPCPARASMIGAPPRSLPASGPTTSRAVMTA